MHNFLIYDLKVAVCIVVFYMFYRLLLSKETFHRVNRIVLLSTAVLSFILPLCVITMHETVVVQRIPQVVVGDIEASVLAEPVSTIPLWQWTAVLLYIVGAVLMLCKTFWSIGKVVLLIRRSEQHPLTDGVIVCVTGNTALTPFSWMHYIVMNRSDYDLQDAAILAHERGHIRMHHSYDVVLVDILTALQWFNPAMWMLRADLRAIHEYEADAAVLSQGINARQYQYLLITKATGIGGYSIANGISHSTLKNRITMMLHKKSQASRLLKLLALLPIVGTALALNAETVTDVVYDQPQKNPVVQPDSTISQPMGLNEVVVIEQAPAVQQDTKTYAIRGVVKDKEKKDAIVGAVIRISGSTKGTVTDRNGEFSLEAKKGDRIEVMYVGYANGTVVVSDPQVKFDIRLQKDDSDVSSTNDNPFDVVEEMPQFPGGAAALMQYLSKNIRYPEEAHKNNIQGRVIVNFIVETDGSITEAKVTRSIHPLLDAEALRVINAMPKWNPGMQGGKPVRVKYTVPVTFKLQGNDVKASEEKYILEIDGKVVDDTEIGNIPSGSIASMQVVKAENGQPKKIRITTKKK